MCCRRMAGEDAGLAAGRPAADRAFGLGRPPRGDIHRVGAHGQQALARNDAIRRFLGPTRWSKAERRFLEGDASFRRYETLHMEHEHAILMDMPARPDGPPVKNGKPYSAIAHLAEDIRAVVAVNARSGRRGYSAPRAEAFDLEQGFAVIEDLGRNVYGRMMLAGEDMREPMAAAVAVLADMAGRDWPRDVPLDGGSYHVPPYDIEAQLIEVDLLPSLVLALYARQRRFRMDARAEFESLWAELLPLTQPDTAASGRCATIIRPTCSGCRSARACSASASSTRRTASWAIRPMTSPPCCRMRASTFAFAVADELYEHYCALARAARRFRPRRIRSRLRHSRRPARHQDPRHLREAVEARRQARLSPPHPARLALSRAQSRPSAPRAS